METLVSGPSTFNDGLAIDKDGNIFASRYFSSTVTKITPLGQTTIFASGLTNPNGITFDFSGNLLVPEATANMITLIDTAGNKSLFLNITNPTNLLYLPDGQLLISSYTQDKISIMDTSMNVTDYWTGSELSGGAVGLAYDSIRSEIYVGCYDDGKVLKRDSTGLVTEIGDLPSTCGFICEAGDYIYATGLSNNRVYRIAKDGSGQTVYAGSGTAGQVDGNLTTARFNGPNGIAASSSGDTLFISDYNSRSLRMIIGVNTVASIKDSKKRSELLIYPNPAKDEINFNIPLNETIEFVQIIDSEGKPINESGNISIKNEGVKLPEGLSPGIYQIIVKTSESIYREKISILE